MISLVKPQYWMLCKIKVERRITVGPNWLTTTPPLLQLPFTLHLMFELWAKVTFEGENTSKQPHFSNLEYLHAQQKAKARCLDIFGSLKQSSRAL